MSGKTHLISMVPEASSRRHTHYLTDFIDEFFMALKRTLKSIIYLAHGKILEDHPPIFQDVFLRPDNFFLDAGPQKVGGILPA